MIGCTREVWAQHTVPQCFFVQMKEREGSFAALESRKIEPCGVVTLVRELQAMKLVPLLIRLLFLPRFSKEINSVAGRRATAAVTEYKFNL